MKLLFFLLLTVTVLAGCRSHYKEFVSITPVWMVGSPARPTPLDRKNILTVQGAGPWVQADIHFWKKESEMKAYTKIYEDAKFPSLGYGVAIGEPSPEKQAVYVVLIKTANKGQVQEVFRRVKEAADKVGGNTILLLPTDSDTEQVVISQWATHEEMLKFYTNGDVMPMMAEFKEKSIEATFGVYSPTGTQPNI